MFFNAEDDDDFSPSFGAGTEGKDCFYRFKMMHIFRAILNTYFAQFPDSEILYVIFHH